ncbi:MAG TPA: hypothetical protein VGK82_01600, partial [Pyrinomonadaceae bacterium]
SECFQGHLFLLTFPIVEIKTTLPGHRWRQPITSIGDCQLPIADFPLPKLTIDNWQSAIV